MSRDRDQLMGHASDNDGIEEYDNPLPDWWVGLFILTILFSVGYVAEYHFINQRSQAAGYVAQLDQAKELWPEFGKAQAVTASAEDIEAGKAIYDQNCIACHGPELTGGIGPDLTDKVWIHGGTPEAIAHTITVGVPEKGMLTWGPILGPGKVSQVASYIVSKGGALKPGEEPAAAPAEPEPAPEGAADEAAPADAEPAADQGEGSGDAADPATDH